MRFRKVLKKKFKGIIIGTLFAVAITTGCTSNESKSASSNKIQATNVTSTSIAQEPNKIQEVTPTFEPQQVSAVKDKDTMEYAGKSYKIITVDGGDKSGSRQPNAAVDVGYGDRVYWAYTNEYGQLISVTADKVIVQDDSKEPVTSSGRYYKDEAKVPGTERSDLDQAHVIADSLGGVSNAYNITPQDSALNRHGAQAYMEKVIRDAGGCENFVAIITYPDSTTQIPLHYHYEYDLKGNRVVDDFYNVNPKNATKK